MTNKQLEKKNMELTLRISQLADKFVAIERQLSRLENYVSKDMKNVVEMIKKSSTR